MIPNCASPARRLATPRFEFHRFQELSAELTAVNERSAGCDPPGRSGTLERGEKKAAAVHQQMAREVNRLLGLVFAERNRTGQTDRAALEMAFRGSFTWMPN